jgi:glucose/arabinose dehydrogenase
MKKFLFLFITLLPAFAPAQPKLVPHPVKLKDGRTFSFNLPAGYEISPAAEGLKRVRFFAKSPDGRIFVTDMYNLTDNKKGAVYILDGWDAEAGKFARVIPYMTGLKNPNSVQFYTDASGQDWLYLAETDKLTRRKFTRGETKPTDNAPQALATFPDYGLSYKYGGWHLTRTIAFAPNGKMYVSVGSSCNSCEEKEKVRASVLEMDPDGGHQKQFASGLRNAVGLKWLAGNLFASNQGSDHLGLGRPDETFYALRGGADYGWPYCHSANGHIFADPKLKRAGGCRGAPAPYAFFPSHSSSLGFDYFDDSSSDAALKDAFLVSLHGSTDKTVGHGYKIVLMRKGRKLQDFITGFLTKGTVNGRPCDIMRLDAGSFLFTDDNHGIVYYVRKKGWISQITAEPEKAATANTQADINGAPAAQNSRSCWPLGLVLFAFCVRSVMSN